MVLKKGEGKELPIGLQLDKNLRAILVDSDVHHVAYLPQSIQEWKKRSCFFP
jgi:hypothetical protein